MDPKPLTKAWILGPTLKSLLSAYAESGDTEPCGVLLGRIQDDAVRIEEAPQTPNSHPFPKRAFRVAPQDILRVARDARAKGFTLVGFWHGHLGSPPHPGDADLEGMEEAEDLGPNTRLMVIIGAGAGRAPVVRAYSRGPYGPREVPLAT